MIRMQFKTKTNYKIMKCKTLMITNSGARILSPTTLMMDSLHKSRSLVKNPKNLKASCHLPPSSLTILTLWSVKNPKIGAKSTDTFQKPNNKTEWLNKGLQKKNNPYSWNDNSSKSWKWFNSTSKIRILSI